MSNRLLQVFGFILLNFCASALAQQKMIQLEKDLILPGDNIGMIQGINVDKRGRIYVGDIINAKIHLYSATGQYLPAIGRKGRGPGEFLYIWGSQLNGGDSLFVLDGQLRMLTVFRSDEFQTPVHSITLPGGPEGDGPSIAGTMRTGYRGLWVTRKNELLIAYSTDYSDRNLDLPRYLKIYQLDSSGKFIGDKPIVQVPDQQMLVIRDKGFRVSSMPFGSYPVIGLGASERLYYGHTDKLSISIFDMSRKSEIGTITYPLKQIRITSKMWEQELHEWPGRSLTMDVIKRSRTPVPEYLPAFEDFVVDDKERIWIAINTEDRRHYRWLVFNREGKLIADFTHTKEVMLKLVKNGYAYGIQTESNGAQSVVRYRVIEKNQP